MTLLTDDEHRRLRELCDAPQPYVRDARPIAEQWYPVPRTIGVDVETVRRFLAEREARLAAEAEVRRARKTAEDVAYASTLRLERIAALEARVRELEGERGWRPIETAPKDGTTVLARQGNWAAFHTYWNGDSWSPVEYNGSFRPTHWQPLPLPPAGTTE